MVIRSQGFPRAITVLTAVCLMGLPAPARFAGGTGEPNDPYGIATAEQLISIGSDPNLLGKHYILLNDIDLDPNLPGGRVFDRAVIAPDIEPSDYMLNTSVFTGVFDGGGHTISHLTVTGESYLGLFGRLRAGAEVRNLSLADSRISGSDDYVGALVGYNYDGRLTNCHNSGVVDGHSYLGGLVGYSFAGDIAYCSSAGTVRGDWFVGGLVGDSGSPITHSYSASNVTGHGQVGGLVGIGHVLANCCSMGTVSGVDGVGGLAGLNNGWTTQCYATGSVSGIEHVGGLVGNNDRALTQCYSTGAVVGRSYVGGLLGRNFAYGDVVHCYSTGPVVGSEHVGGLVGESRRSGVIDSLWDIETSGQDFSAGGTGKSTAQMQTAATFFTWGPCNEGVWTIQEGRDYPRLAWEGLPGRPIVAARLSDLLRGTGSREDPFLIYTAEDLHLIGLYPCEWDKQFILMADIDLSAWSGTPFHRIGVIGLQPFRGVFDGNDHTIAGFTLTSTGMADIGLFGWIDDPNAVIRNLGLVDPHVDAGTGDRVGALAGYLWAGTIVNCYVEGGRVCGDYYVGGLVGECANKGILRNCYSTSVIDGNVYAGGIAGSNDGMVAYCYSAGRITCAKEEYAGGLVGGGGGAVIQCFWDIETSGLPTRPWGVGKSTIEMQSAATFFVWGVCGNGGTWTIDDGRDYPRLWWQQAAGRVIGAESAALSDLLLGAGVEDDPFQIHTAEELNLIGLFPCEWDKHFQLLADLDLSAYSGTSFNMIGSGVPFTGVFDGDDHTLANFTYTPSARVSAGLFSYVSSGATIRNLRLLHPCVGGPAAGTVGSLVAQLSGASVTHCHAEGPVVSGAYVGGLVGHNGGVVTGCSSLDAGIEGSIAGGLVGGNGGDVVECRSTGKVQGGSAGGLAGRNYGRIRYCFSEVDVVGIEGDAGGLTSENSGSIASSYSMGTVSGVGYVGGLVGGNSGPITQCYSTGAVAQGDGLVGYDDWYYEILVIDCFWDVQTSGQPESSGGTGKTTAEMYMARTFVDWAPCESQGAWTINEGKDYPRLWWENRPGQPLTTPRLSGLLRGAGTRDDPFLIHTAEEFNLIGQCPCEWGKHFRLVADIDLSAYRGTSFNIIQRFFGVFDGGGHTISNFTYACAEGGNVGLFASVRGSGTMVRRLGLIDPNINAEQSICVGSLIGLLEGGTVADCYVKGSRVSGNWHVGGLVGENSGSMIHCYSEGVVHGGNSVGGLVGLNWGSVTRCYSRTSVSGRSRIGGLVGGNGWCDGWQYVCWPGTIRACYSTGPVTATERGGGLVGSWVGGDFEDGEITACFWDTQTSGQISSAGGAGRTTAEMQTTATFLQAGWDFVGETANGAGDFWWIVEGREYPRLWWESAATAQ